MDLRFPEGGVRAGGLLVRRPEVGDIDAIVAACQDPEIPRWTYVPSPYERRHAEEFVAGVAARPGRGDGGIGLVVLEAATEELVGSTGLAAVSLARQTVEVGYWVARHARGRGIATRAVRIVTDWALACGVQRVELHVFEGNVASIQVAQRAGFRHDGVLRSYEERGGRRLDLEVFSRLPHDPAVP